MAKKEPTEKDIEYTSNLQYNMDLIARKYAKTRAEFYGRYLYPLTKEYEHDCKTMKPKDLQDYLKSEPKEQADRQSMTRLIKGDTTPTYEQLVVFSEVSGVSINELLTTKADLDSKPRTLRDVLITLFTLLDRMYFKTHKVTSNGRTGYIISPRLKPTRATDAEYNDYVFGSIINEFLKEYEEQKHKSPEDYRSWRKQILRGAFGYTIDGSKAQGIQPLDEITKIVERAKKSRRILSEEQAQADREAEEEREQYQRTHGFCGYTKEQWREMPEEKQDEIYKEWSLNRLEADQETAEDQEPESTQN